ncbi:methyl-accepting chemotaxis protein [Fundidesulfovibrio terrae]|uniref:methyl-accepting chemotaxis protein n=1 Tax=Fundidesulfovibrio terrae TaxID=2922866 RepID=UPI001FAF0EC2|nr:methyl-accepting chemotaxis protein [Fundidesulfovibrio terrae]
MQFKSIKSRIAVMAAVCLMATSAVLVVFSLFQTRGLQEYTKENVTKLINKTTELGLLAIASEQAGFIQGELQANLDTARTLAKSFSVLKKERDTAGGAGQGTLRNTLNEILLAVLKDNPKFLGTYSAWEPNAIDGRDKDFAGNKTGGYDDTGRFIPYWNRDEKGNIARQALVEYESQDKHPNGVRKGGWYLGPRETGKESVLDPFPYIVQGKQDWLTTLSVPIVVDGKFLGVAGTDLRLNFLQDLSKEVAQKLYGGQAEVVVISNMGLIVAHSGNPKLIGEHVKSFLPDNWQEVVETVQAGKSLADLGQVTGMVRAFAPIQLGRTGKPWSVLIRVKPDVVMADANILEKGLKDKSDSAVGWQTGVGSAVTLAAVVLLWFFSGGIVRPIRKSADFAGSVAEGDFTKVLDVRQSDEIGMLADALRTMVENLKKMIHQAEQKGQEAEEEARKANDAMAEAEQARKQADQAQREGILAAANKLVDVVERLTSASDQLSGQIEQAARGSTIQKSRAEEAATAMSEMNSTVLEVARNALHASEGTDNAKKMAQEGADVVRQVVEAIRDVQTQAERLKENMSALGRQAEGIGQIIDVISDIADQTNLLALNAAIEAARAGDAGRGFAVVADEVRKLAEKTMSATNEVGNTIREIQNGARTNITSMDDASKAVDKATNLANKSGESLKEIVSIVEVSSDQVRAIATASEEQSAASEEINRSVEEVNQISSETVQAMEQSAQAVVELANQAQVLRGLIEEMQSEGGSSRSGSRALGSSSRSGARALPR